MRAEVQSAEPGPIFPTQPRRPGIRIGAGHLALLDWRALLSLLSGSHTDHYGIPAPNQTREQCQGALALGAVSPSGC